MQLNKQTSLGSEHMYAEPRKTIKRTRQLDKINHIAKRLASSSVEMAWIRWKRINVPAYEIAAWKRIYDMVRREYASKEERICINSWLIG